MKLESPGFSIVELMMATAVTGVVFGGVAAMVTSLDGMQNRNRIDSLLNQTYYQGLQTANNPVLFTDRGIKSNPLHLTQELLDCLAGHGVKCDATFPPQPSQPLAEVPPAVEDSLNASFSFNGRCHPGDRGCLVKRVTTYQWECPFYRECTGLRINLSAEVIADARFKKREGSLVIPGRQFVPKAQINFRCPSSSGGATAVWGVDFQNRLDACADYDSKTACAMPMKTYGVADACVTQQQKPCDSTNSKGYNVAGFFDSQRQCADDASPKVTPSTVTTTPTPNVDPNKKPKLQFTMLSLGHQGSWRGHTMDVKADGSPCSDGILQGWWGGPYTAPAFPYANDPSTAPDCPDFTVGLTVFYTEGKPCQVEGSRCEWKSGTTGHMYPYNTRPTFIWLRRDCSPYECVDITKCPNGGPANDQGVCVGQAGVPIMTQERDPSLDECPWDTNGLMTTCPSVGYTCRRSFDNAVVKCGRK